MPSTPQARLAREATPGTPRRDQRRPPRERLLRAATRLFYRHGINAVGIEAVIAEADVARMSLYRHFGSKDELVAACLDQLDRYYHDWFVDQVEQRNESARHRLLAAFDVLDEWIHSDDFRGCAFINAAVELADPQHAANSAVLAHKARNRGYLEELATQAGAPDPSTLARQMLLLIEGAIVTALVQGDRNAARDAQAVAADLLTTRLVNTQTSDAPCATCCR